MITPQTEGIITILGTFIVGLFAYLFGQEIGKVIAMRKKIKEKLNEEE